ncbi:hypothetical protein QBC46DRAFT_254271 [Diplogelasinospora grovesii]|uniref:Nucleoside phosphorylase domain-containing protein n=1 Tax=Diplogelasinospora grovesii TaxID=303347 RepID=A0AAN6NCU2_9PEZI|nr:hypothetical protein QBC46DRAFT_254271 [Diplogelasinospora grovesii]
MNKRPHQDDEPDASHSKRQRTFDIASNGGVQTSHDASPPLAHGDYTIAWICALPLELAASRAMLDEEHRLLPSQPGDDNAYVLGRIDEHNVVMACLPGQYGTNNAAIVATDLKRSFPSIRATLMVGIGGGAPSMADLRLGDVVVGTRVMQYDMGKDVGDGRFEITAHPKIPSRRLLSAVTNLRAIHERDASSARVRTLLRTRLSSHTRPSQPDRLFQASYEHLPGAPTCDGCDPEKVEPRRVRVSDEPKIYYGGIASGNRVMRNARTRDDNTRRLSVLCFEMEAAGMMDNLQCLPIRGICDYSDSHKNKDWQSYAAATAAAYSRELLEALPPAFGEPGRATTWFSTVSKPDTVASERRQRLLESLDFPKIDARKTTIRAAHAKTCRWFLRHSKYQDWLDPGKQSRNHGFLWMRGKAGAGKSTMMKFVYLETKKKSKNTGTAVASFFFNARGDYLEKSITGMYRSLLTQLLKVFPDLQPVLDDTDIVPWSQQDCPDLNALKELLRSAVMALGQRSFTCFIDALDECDEQEVRDMVQFFEELAETTTDGGIQFRICFSSRPYPYIDIRPEVLLTLEEESGHADDLAQYVRSHLRIANVSLHAELQAQILDKAAGIFMWIVLVVEILNKESSHGALALRRRLAEIPSKLSELFKNILTRDQDRVEWLLLCVLWVLCAKRPLSPAEFRHALWAGLLEQDMVDPDLPDDTDMDAVKLVTSSSKGLAEVTKSKQPTVQFIHESVRDFLVKENGLRELWPDLGFEWESRSHERLRRCCATYLSLPGVQAIVNGPEDGDERDALAGRYSFLEYATQQVLYHANVAALVIPQDDFLSQFFASAGIRVINLFERFKSRRYGRDATPLYVLADKGLENLIRPQMKNEVAILAPGERYEYPLFTALANGHKGAAAALLGLSSITCDGVDITEGLQYKKDLTRYTGRTPLSWAAQEGRLSIVKALVEGGADTNESDRSGHKPFLRASSNGHEDVARLLIDSGADIHARYRGWTALMWASLNGHEAVARLLIDNGADVNARDLAGVTVLICASRSTCEAVVRLLIEKGADVDTRDLVGWTALIWASAEGCEAVARLLIDSRADVRAQAKDGWTALIGFSKHGYEAVARLLIEKGADVDTRDLGGWTALIWASSNGHEAVARLLIEQGADVDARAKDGRTALMQASSKGHEAVARLLRCSSGEQRG